MVARGGYNQMTNTRDSGPLRSAIERLALVLNMTADNWTEVVVRATNELASEHPARVLKGVGTVIGPRKLKDMNERAIARIDETRVVARKGKRYTVRGRSCVATKDITKTTRGFRVQFRYLGVWHRKFFSDGAHSGPFGARAAARKWRDEEERRCGRNVVHETIAVRTWNPQSKR